MGVLFVFVDGLGLGSADPAVNPLEAGDLPFLGPLLSTPGDRVLPGTPRMVSVDTGVGYVVAADACLGVPGVPQSATGQTALLTGCNAPAYMGRHVSAFPTGRLKAYLERRNLLTLGTRAGRRVTFLNMFRPEGLGALINGARLASATTAAALAAGLRLRTIDDLLRGQAVFHDVTCWTIAGEHYGVPVVPAAEAARRALRVAGEHDFCLYEYFLTDLAGHSGDRELCRTVLTNLDRFLSAVVAGLDGTRESLVLASDHGNIEDVSHEGHTANPVPVAAFGRMARETVLGVSDITRVAGRVARLADVPGVPDSGAAAGCDGGPP